MFTENYYEYNGDIDLDAQSLYDYVNNQVEVQKAINNVVPKNPETFGKAAEPFNSINNIDKDYNKEINLENELETSKKQKKNEEPNYFRWIIFILLCMIALYFLMKSQFVCKDVVRPHMIMHQMDTGSLDAFTPAVGSEFKAIFAR